ncbi:hypothetical protein ACI2K4_07015 [Micromonospora sp. NPDC050397]|uniref:hypothetical protein n=1 Tax=Micromonospora sp. NPDC050397 TaxID=3364279 RepID=UPI00384F6899
MSIRLQMCFDRLIDAVESQQHCDSSGPVEAEYVLGGEVKVVHLGVELTFESNPHGSDEQFEAFLDEVIDQLDRIGREVSLAARLADRVADFAATIEADEIEGALSLLLPDLRAALHAAGCSTAGWPEFIPKSPVIRELQDV